MGKSYLTLYAALFFSTQIGAAQGFVNFEGATFVSDPTSVYYPTAVYAAYAIPGWTAYVAGSPISEIFSNSIYVSGGCVSIVDTNWNLPQMQGKYFIWLLGNYDPQYKNTAAIGQTGQIPVFAQSLTFWGNVGANDVSFKGQTLTLAVIGSTANYNIYGADISAFAGQTGQLLFSTAPGGSDKIDNIQFSSNPIPEPEVLALASLGAILLGFRRLRKS